ncbi:MAG: L-threonylcarbamoyladenylate synthase [Dehalococcoidales bacterium]
MLDKSVVLQEQIERGIAILKSGGLVVFPTDTVYGLGACFSNLSAVERIYRLKKRPRNVALPLLLADTAQMSQIAAAVPAVAWLLAGRFWPGALTIVLPRAKLVPDIITGGGETVAVRMPAHAVPIALIKGLGAPMAATSANMSGQSSALTAAEAFSQLGDRIDLIIDGGRCFPGTESTIVDVTAVVPRLLREGALSREELGQVCEIV